jgi:hypothetical protein
MNGPPRGACRVCNARPTDDCNSPGSDCAPGVAALAGQARGKRRALIARLMHAYCTLLRAQRFLRETGFFVAGFAAARFFAVFAAPRAARASFTEALGALAAFL